MVKHQINKFMVLYGILVFAYLISNLESVQGNYFFSNLKYIMMLIIVVVTFSSKKNINDTFSYVPKIFLIFLMVFVLFPLIGFLKYASYQILLNSMLSLIYILFLIITLNIIKEELAYRKIINTIYYSIFVFLLLILILNGESIININNITSAFNLDDRIRQTYGLKHANTIGNICLIFIIVGLNKKQWCINIKEKLFILFLEVITLFIMLNSGSRTALTASILLYILFYLNKYILFKNKLLNRISLIMGIMLIILCILCLMYFKETINMDDLLANSNRYYWWIDTIKFLENNMNVLIGLGYVNISYFYQNMQFSTNLVTDNWFLYTYMTLGLIGIIFSLIIIGAIFSKMFRYTPKYKNIAYMYILSLIITGIYYACFEAVYFTPSELLSFVYWIFILRFLSDKNNFNY